MIPLTDIVEFKNDEVEKGRLKRMLEITQNFENPEDSAVAALKMALCERPGSEARENHLKTFFNQHVAGSVVIGGTTVEIPGWIESDEKDEWTKGLGWVIDQLFLLYALDGGCWWLRCP